MGKPLNFPNAAVIAANTMYKMNVFAEVKRMRGGWMVLAGGKPSGDTPWVNLWRSMHNAISKRTNPNKIFWAEFDRLVQIKNSTAIAAAREVFEFEQAGSTVRSSFFHKSDTYWLKEYSKDSEDSPSH